MCFGKLTEFILICSITEKNYQIFLISLFYTRKSVYGIHFLKANSVRRITS